MLYTILSEHLDRADKSIQDDLYHNNSNEPYRDFENEHHEVLHDMVKELKAHGVDKTTRLKAYERLMKQKPKLTYYDALAGLLDQREELLKKATEADIREKLAAMKRTFKIHH